jgi:hypothetical protein
MLIESVLYISLGLFVLFALAIYAVKGIGKTKKAEGRILLTREQLGCHGVWLGQNSENETFYFCVHEIGQLIEGVFHQDGNRTQFSGTYLAPVLTFEKADDDGSVKTFRGVVDRLGASISGQCSEYGSERSWSAKLLSAPAQTKSLELGALDRLTLTHMSPEAVAARFALLTAKAAEIESSAAPETESMDTIPIQSTVPGEQPLTAQPVGPTAINDNVTTFCSNCQRPVDEAFNFCLHCGHSHKV